LVSSVQGSIGTTVDTALANGLADINAAIAALEAQVDNIASAEDVDAINSSLDGIETDLDDLLASNNIYSGDLLINSVATLEFAENLKDKVTIINGSVFIEQSSEMDSVRLQTVASKIKTITGDLVIRAQVSSVGGVTLDSLTGVSNLKIAQPGSISFPVLKSAQEVVFGNNYRVDGDVNFEMLSSVGKFISGSISDGTNAYADYVVGGTENNTITLPKAASIKLGALSYYTPRNLTINGDDDTVLDLSKLESKDANGRARSYTLDVNGALALNIPGLVEGSVTVEDVADVELTGFTGKITVKTGVLNVAVGALKNDFDATAADDLVSVDLTMDAADKKADFTGATDLESAKIAGKVKTVTFSGNSNLTSLDLTAAIESLTINDTDLTEATLDYTNANLAEKGTLTITGNKDLTAIYVDKVDGLATLTITDNDELTMVSFDALTNLPTKESVLPAVKIGGTTDDANDLNAELIDQDESDHTKGGSFTTNSGLDDLKTYLAAADKRVGSSLKVFFDRADEYSVDGAVQTPPSGGFKIGGSHDRALTVINSFGQAGAAKSKRSWIITGDPASGSVVTLVANSISAATDATSAVGIDNLFAAVNTAAFKANFDPTVGTLTVTQGASPTVNIILTETTPATTVTVTTASSTTSADNVEVKIGDYVSKVYLTTADDTSFSNNVDGKKAYRELIGASGANTASSVLQEVVEGFNAIADFPFIVEVSTSATSATLMVGAKDQSTKYHGTAVSYANSNASNGIETSAIKDIRGIIRGKLYGYSIQLTLESKTAGVSISEGGPSEIGNPPTATGGTDADDGTANGQAQLTSTGGTVVELGKPKSGTAALTDSPGAVTHGAGTSSGTDVDHVSWL
jgi:hypothetical protein